MKQNFLVSAINERLESFPQNPSPKDGHELFLEITQRLAACAAEAMNKITKSAFQSTNPNLERDVACVEALYTVVFDAYVHLCKAVGLQSEAWLQRGIAHERAVPMLAAEILARVDWIDPTEERMCTLYRILCSDILTPVVADGRSRGEPFDQTLFVATATALDILGHIWIVHSRGNSPSYVM